MPALVVEGISKSYGNFKVLKSVSFDVHQGQIFGLLGPNGAGKSTLIKVLIGFEKADSGKFSYSLKGKEILGNQVKERVSIIPQNLCFYEGFSPQKNLEIMGSLYGLWGKKLHERIELLLEEWNLKKFRKRKALKLSGGYKRLLNIACGLINDPAIIFLDEPTVGLDPKIRNSFWQKILGLKSQGKTILLTTHYMDEAEFLCDEIGVIVKGEIAIEFPVSKLIARKISVEELFLKVVEERGIKREDI